jgi:hypothetical protein
MPGCNLRPCPCTLITGRVRPVKQADCNSGLRSPKHLSAEMCKAIS